MRAQVSVLGATALVVDGSPVRLPARPRAVLTALALAFPEPVPASRLADVLWHGNRPRSAVNAVQVYVSAVRKAVHGAGWVGDFVHHRDGGYLLDTEVEVDLHQLRDLVRDAQRLLDQGDPRGAERLLAGRTDVDASRVLADLPPDVAPGMRRSVQALLDRSRLVWLRALVGAGRPDRALPVLLGLGEEHPERGDVAELTARAYYAASRPAEALGVLRRHGEHLRRDFGLDPGEWLPTLQSRILSNDPDLLTSESRASAAACTHTSPGAEWDAVVCARAVGALVAGGSRDVEDMPGCLHRSLVQLGEWAFLVEAVTGALTPAEGVAPAAIALPS